MAWPLSGNPEEQLPSMVADSVVGAAAAVDADNEDAVRRSSDDNELAVSTGGDTYHRKNWKWLSCRPSVNRSQTWVRRHGNRNEAADRC